MTFNVPLSPQPGMRPHVAPRCFSHSPFPIPHSRLASGFTLIEVLIALAVVAIALLALTRAASVQVSSFDALRERTLAGWVAANVLTDTRLAGAMPATGRSDGRVEFAGRSWRWEREVKATPTPAVRRIDIQVFTGAARAPSASLSGFAGTALTQ
jgi:general secretion pathway protein I